MKLCLDIPCDFQERDRLDDQFGQEQQPDPEAAKLAQQLRSRLEEQIDKLSLIKRARTESLARFQPPAAMTA